MYIPSKLQEIVDDFAGMTREEKIETLIGYAESLPPLPDWLLQERAMMDAVPECMTPVNVFGEKKDGKLTFHFDIPPQSPPCAVWRPSWPMDLTARQPKMFYRYRPIFTWIWTCSPSLRFSA